jgi:hypothetical protein
MKDLPGVVFPHVVVSERDIKRILSFFGPLTLFRPWFLEGQSLDPVRVLNPPEDLKPEEDFKARLSEYRSWITYNREKNFKDFVIATRGIQDGEDTSWDIRGTLRRMGRARPAPDEVPSLKWHLVLHLAGDLEKDQEEAETLLGALKEKSSPLKGAIEEEAREQARGLFDDLPRFASDRIMDDFLLEQVFEAWFGLFGGYLEDHDLLITSSRQVMDYVSGLREEVWGQDPDAPVPAVEFRFPDLSGYPLEELLDIKERDYNSERVRELKETLSVFGKDPAGRLPALGKLAKEVEASRLSAPGGETVTIRVTGPLPPGAPSGTKGVIKDLFGRTIVLVEKSS